MRSHVRKSVVVTTFVAAFMITSVTMVSAVNKQATGKSINELVDEIKVCIQQNKIQDEGPIITLIRLFILFANVWCTLDKVIALFLILTGQV